MNRRRVAERFFRKASKLVLSAAILLMVEGHASALPRNPRLSQPEATKNLREKRDGKVRLMESLRSLQKNAIRSRETLLDPSSNNIEFTKALKSLVLMNHDWEGWKISIKNRKRILDRVTGLLNDPEKETRYAATSALKDWELTRFPKSSRKQIVTRILKNLEMDPLDDFGISYKVIGRMSEPEALLVFKKLEKSGGNREMLVNVLGAFNWRLISRKLNTLVVDKILSQVKARQMQIKSGGGADWPYMKESVYLLSRLDWERIQKSRSAEVESVLSPIFTSYAVGGPLYNYRENATRGNFARLLMKMGEPGVRGIVFLLRINTIPGIFYPMINALSNADPKELDLDSKSIYDLIQAVGPYTKYKHPEIDAKDIRKKADRIIRMLNKLEDQKARRTN